MMLPWILCGVLSVLVAGLLRRARLAARSADAIAAQLTEKLAGDTNTPIAIPTRDRHLRALASALNRELRTLRALRHRYELGDRELMEAIANVSHDLRTPLTAISGYAQLLERGALTEEQRGYVNQILSRSKAMAELTEELLRSTVLLSGTPEVKTRVDLRAELEESLAGAYTRLRDRGMTVRADLPEAPVMRELDAAALRRVLDNIVSNAALHGEGELHVTLTDAGTFTFRNPAPSLTKADAARLFDRFCTVDPARRTTGLGLSIAKTLAQRLGATITATVDAGALEIKLAWESA